MNTHKLVSTHALISSMYGNGVSAMLAYLYVGCSLQFSTRFWLFDFDVSLSSGTCFSPSCNKLSDA